MKTPALSALLDRFHNFPMPGNPDQHNCYCGPEEIEAARAELANLISELAIAQSAARVLAHCYDRDARPPLDVLNYGRGLPVRLPHLPLKEKP